MLDPWDINVCSHGFISFCCVWVFKQFLRIILFLSAPRGWGRGGCFSSSGQLLHEFRYLEFRIFGKERESKTQDTQMEKD